ncbi:MAG: DUF4921 family protein [Candidatus Omnitrophica bacterium]|nr:DUF4921 family protein [Candidatus Omnitrophota bacterium]
MPELRKDPLTNRWVIISTERAKRPDEFLEITPDQDAAALEECPFCAGNEIKTAPEITALRPAGGAPNSPGWSVRVIPSVAPVLRIEGSLEQKSDGVHSAVSGIGAHELVIETPHHIRSLWNLPDEQIRSVIQAYIQRIVDLERDPRFKYVMLFKNYGKAAGEGRFRHSRSQLIALPITPIRLRDELGGSRLYFQMKQRCIFCDIIRQESETQERIAAETASFVALAPFASRFPFEVWILPKNHSSDFTRMPPPQQSDLATILKITLGKLCAALGDPPLNYILHTAPFRRPHPGYWQTIDNDFHWHLEIMPRLTRVAGFEWGSGFYINPITPEETARFLRRAVFPLPPEPRPQQPVTEEGKNG